MWERRGKWARDSNKKFKLLLSSTYSVSYFFQQIGPCLLPPSEWLGLSLNTFPYVSYSLSLIAHTECMFNPLRKSSHTLIFSCHLGTGQLMSLKLIFPIPGLQMGIMEKVRGQISYEDNNDNAELSAENQNLKVRGKQTISVTTQFFFHPCLLS